MERIKELILRFLREGLSSEEEQELEVWLAAAPRNRELLVEIQNADSMAAAFAKLEQLNKTAVWERMRIHSEEQQTGAQAGEYRSVFFRRRWWVAAAVVLLITGGYVWSRHKTEMAIARQAPSPAHDVLPGTNKAVLTLSNGRRIVLDSTAKDTVLIQGTAIVANADGHLAYNKGSSQTEEIVYNTLTTPKGGQHKLTLPDGSTVWLNAASSITYPTAFAGNSRKVTMTGEGYFEITKDVDKPFEVNVDNQVAVKVLGTSFNINAYDDEQIVKTTLLEGSVRVSTPEGSVSSEQQEKMLTPGEQVQLVVGVDTNNGSGKYERLRVVNDVNVEEVVAWKNGRFAFTDADLPTVMRQLARWYNIDVSYEGDIPKREFNGKIGKSLTLDQVLKVLTKTRVNYTIEGHKLTIRP